MLIIIIIFIIINPVEFSCKLVLSSEVVFHIPADFLIIPVASDFSISDFVSLCFQWLQTILRISHL